LRSSANIWRNNSATIAGQLGTSHTRRYHRHRHAEGVGHGRKPPLWVKPGDTLEVEITRIGVLRTHIVNGAR